MLHFVRQRWFLFALLFVLASGMVWWHPLQPVSERIPRNVVVATVMLLMALPMETGAMWQAVRRPGAAWLAAAINLGLAPPLGWLAGRLLPPELAIGVIVTTLVPCTLAAATVWTRRAGGNDAVAILVTIITNLACFLVIPMWLRIFLGSTSSTVAEGLNYADLTLQLVLLVVAPIVVAQLIRQWKPAAEVIARRKSVLSTLAQIGILSFVFAGAVRCGEEIHNASSGDLLSVGNVALMIVIVIVVHLTLLAIGLASALALGMNRADAIAVGISGSQKTIMVGLFLAIKFGATAILPMVAYHAAQLLLDTIIADWLRARPNDGRITHSMIQAGFGHIVGRAHLTTLWRGSNAGRLLSAASRFGILMDSINASSLARPVTLRFPMKDGIHPDYFETQVSCGCGNKFVTRSTRKELKVDICSVCHPFYTGKLKFVDTAGRIEKFKTKFAAAGYASLNRGKK